jgi:hypothetical protein
MLNKVVNVVTIVIYWLLNNISAHRFNLLVTLRLRSHLNIYNLFNGKYGRY